MHVDAVGNEAGTDGAEVDGRADNSRLAVANLALALNRWVTMLAPAATASRTCA